MYVVYSLVDPRNSTTRYVGITDDLYRRFQQHIRCEGRNIDKNAWIQDLRDANVMLIMKTIEIVETVEEARERETYWIKKYTSGGAILLNVSGTKSFTYEDFLVAMGTAKGTEDADSVDEPLSDPASTNPSAKGPYVMTYEEAMKYTHLSLSTLKRKVRSGEIEASANGKLRVRSLERWRRKSSYGTTTVRELNSRYSV